jgi:hypothetical protein
MNNFALYISKRIMRPILLVLLFVLSVQALAQSITLSGKVTDRETNEILPHATITIKGKSIGTIANFLGEFDFHVPSEYRNDIFSVSMIGYENFEVPVWSLDGKKNIVIPLQKSITLLDEVVITDSLMGDEIFRISLARIEQNYPMKPFMLDGFYRDIKKVGGTTIALLEAAVKIYDENYAEPRNKNRLRERVKLIEVRKSLGYENKFTSYFGQNNFLEDLLLHNAIRYRMEDIEEITTGMVRKADSYYNGHAIYVLEYNHAYHIKMYVDKTNFAIIHMEITIDNEGDRLARKNKLVSKYIKQTKVIDFREVQQKLYLNYITVTSNEQWFEKGSNNLKFETELIQYLLINDVDTAPKQSIRSTEKMKNYGLQYQDYPYNKTFWENYNVIKETPLDQKIASDLEEFIPLEKQFAE